ncbi:MAG: hypothetical protein LCH67_08565 [Bacteroidetes bacterium]|nr:hypothetical protein [Bacteroidota bacterium]
MINIFFRFWKIGSFLLLTVVVLFCYANLPEKIAINFDDNGNPVGFVSQQQFFYWTAGVIFFINFLVSLLKNAIIKLNFKALNPNSLWANQPQATTSLISTWFNAFLAIVNTFLIFVVLGINNINSDKNQMLDFNYNWFIIGGAALLLIIIFWLPVRLLFTNPPSED